MSRRINFSLKTSTAALARSSVEETISTTQMVLLVKPQFEAGRVEVSRGKGVITDPEIHAETIQTVQECVESLGGTVLGLVESPIKGAEGNTEFLMFVECSTSSVGCET
jgi:predicted rRNA methylase YqxC with S4 and FtsJ domains